MLSVILAIDIGTTSTKALVVSEYGKVIASHQKFYPTLYPQPGWAEQNPEEIYQAVLEVIKVSNSEIQHSYKLEAISFSSAMHSIMALSENGSLLTNAIIWADTRSTSEAKELKNSDRGRRLHKETGTPVHPMSPLCKLIWLRTHHPSFASVHKFISIKEYVLHKLTGEFVVDYSIASASGLFELSSKQWHPLALELTGICTQQLSKLVEPKFRVTIRSEIQSELNLHNAEIVVGASDGCLAQLGSGAMQPGDLTITIGTSAAVRRAVSHVKDPMGKLFNYWLYEDAIISGGASNNGTVIVDWFNRQFGDTNNTLTDFVNDALTVEPGADGLLALPYLQGERAPIYNPDAKGVFFGLSVTHTSAHFKRALLEGICYEILSMVESVEEVQGPSNRIFVSGGFTYSPGWVQLLSDILQRELIHAEVADASALGAAIIGFESISKSLKIDEIHTTTFRPDAEFSSVYKSRYGLFKRLYERLEPLFDQLP